MQSNMLNTRIFFDFPPMKPPLDSGANGRLLCKLSSASFYTKLVSVLIP